MTRADDTAPLRCAMFLCLNHAAFRVHWPGRDALPMCVTCATRAQSIARAMGMHLQIEVLP